LLTQEHNHIGRSCSLLPPHPSTPCSLSFQSSRALPAPHSFPTRRSSDLGSSSSTSSRSPPCWPCWPGTKASVASERPTRRCSSTDRKSTRLNSSHVAISYAVFCLKKKNNRTDTDLNDALCLFQLSLTVDP